MITELTLCATALSNVATAITTPAPAYVAIGNDSAAIECGGELIRIWRDEDENSGDFDRRTMAEAAALSPFVRQMTFCDFRKMLADQER